MRTWRPIRARWPDRLDSVFPRLGWTPPQAGYLAWIDLRPLAVDDTALRERLVHHEKVAVMSGATNGAPGFARLDVGCPRAKAEAGTQALVRALRACGAVG